MGIVLFRLDERLIHGQVVVAWGEYLKPDRIVIFNNQVASSPWERELYMCCVPPDFQASVYNLEEASRKLSNGAFDSGKIIALVDSPSDILDLQQKGITIPEINIGGMHYSQGREKILPYLYVSKEDKEIFKKLIGQGVRFYCQDVPTAEKKDLKELL